MTGQEAVTHLAALVRHAGGTAAHEALSVVAAAVDAADAAGRPVPVAYATLAGKRAETPSEAVAAELSSALDDVETKMRQGVSRALAGIYTEGVRDGFVQGVAAECARRDENGGEP